MSAMTSLEERFAEACRAITGHDPRRVGREWRTRCPSHEDANPSLDFHESDNGKLLVSCRAGCAFPDICDAASFKPDSDFEPDIAFSPRRDKPNGRPVRRRYTYENTDGSAFGQKIRFDDSLSPKMLWDPPLKGTRAPIYKLRAVLAAKAAGETLFVVEGERDCETLRAFGLTATTPPHGAGSPWLPEYTAALEGADIVVLQDADEPGRKHARKVAAALLGRARSVRVIPPFEIPSVKGADVSDAVERGLTREAFLALVEATLPEAEGSAFAAAEEWPGLLPLDGAGPLPEFPLDALPDELAAFVREIAENVQVAAELPAALALAVLATASQGRFQVAVGKTHEEPLSLYVCVAAEPGERKSECFRRVTEPLEAVEKCLVAAARPEITKAQARFDIAKAKLDDAKKRAAKATDENEQEALTAEAEELAASLPAVPAMPRLICGDSTPEKLASLLAAHGRIGCFDGDAGVFTMLAGRYSKEPDIAVWLRAHAGDALRVERMTRDEHVDRPALSAALCVQPSVVAQLGATPNLKGRGLLARFLWALPPSRIGTRSYRESTEWTAAGSVWAALVREVFELGECEPATLRTLLLSEEGLGAFAAFHDRFEAAMVEGGSLAGMRDWGGKAAGAVARIAGIFHVVRHRLGDPVSISITAEDVLRAVAIVDVLAGHARAAFGMVAASPDELLARRIVAWVARRDEPTFTGRDAHRACLPNGKAEEIGRALDLLAERGYLRRRKIRRDVPGRPPSPTFEVRPGLFDPLEGAA